MNRMIRTSLGAAAVVGMLGTGGAGQAADLLAAGSIYGGLNQVRAVCYVYNAGNTPIQMTIPRLLNENGEVFKLAVNQCSRSLGPGLSCGVAADIPNNETFSCKVMVNPSKANVRGILEVRDTNQNVLQNIELR